MTAIEEKILVFQRNDYQRDNFDNFLKHIKFNFDLPGIHIAGTNGKGSTAFYLSSIYQKAGYKVGLFNSPYFYSLKEMISINGSFINDNDITYFYNEYEKLFKKYDLSYFEIMTFIAFEYFKKEKIDLVVIECGMGGEIDATNIFIPNLSIITSVSLEHTVFLGRSISEIAEQKAGIIKYNVPVLCGDLQEEALNTISKIALMNKSLIKTVNLFHNESLKNDGFYFDYLPYTNLHIKSFGYFSISDACLALEATNILRDVFAVNEEQIRAGLESVTIPFRLEKVSDKPLIYLDGAHNPEAMKMLSKSMSKIAYSSNLHVIFACFRDKNIQSMLETLSILSDDVILTTFDHPRARTEEEYFLFAEDYRFVNDYKTALAELKNNCPGDIILFTGSLAFVSFIKKDIFGE